MAVFYAFILPFSGPRYISNCLHCVLELILVHSVTDLGVFLDCQCCDGTLLILYFTFSMLVPSRYKIDAVSFRIYISCCKCD